MLTAMTWLASGPDAGCLFRCAPNRLRRRLARYGPGSSQLYSAPFDALFDSPQAAAELEEVDRMQAIALLIGPLMLGRLCTLTDFDYRTCAEAAVDGFLATHARSPATQRSE